MYTLVICEKPDAARRIAQALGNSSETRRAGIPVYDVTRGETRYIVASAIGHLYGLTDVTASRSVFPVLDLEWAPVAKNARAAKAIGVIAGLAKAASEFVHACDYDQEGEVIGYSILEYACKGKYSGSRRAKFSTLTDDEIKSAFAGTIAPSGGLAAAGRSRHMLDFLYGINLSRALSQSFKSTRGGYRSLSIGRVQGPALAFVYDREGEIRLHIPDPYWKIDALLEGGGEKFTARYSERRVGALAEAREIRDACAHRAGTVSEIETRKVVLHPPTPFNTGDLQQEAYRLFKLSPGYTLAIAEKLYLRALISYPRTSSQKLPQEIGYERIISALSSVPAYSEAARILLSRGRLTPNQGRMSDPAHPAIYPTGVAPRSRLSGLEFKVYDLIVRRFFATFGDPAFSQRTAVAIDIAGYRFDAEGVAISSEGWMSLYRPYVSLERRSLPTMRHGDLLENHGIGMHEEFTQPPRRYNQASLRAKMEKEAIGTKATRADIVSTLFKRNYVTSSRNGMEITDLGMAVVEIMRQHAPAIVSTELTRRMEEQLEKMEAGAGGAEAIEEAVNRLIESLSLLMEAQTQVGEAIADAAASDRLEEKTLGPCPVCKKGQLRVITSRKTKKRFVGCSNFAKEGCRASAPLPQRGSIKASGKTCEHCGWPIVGVLFARRSKQWRICVNMSCPSRKTKDVPSF